jgi:hypothetical protein
MVELVGHYINIKLKIYNIDIKAQNYNRNTKLEIIYILVRWSKYVYNFVKFCTV